MFWLRPFGLLLAVSAFVFGYMGAMTVRYRAEQLLHTGSAIAVRKVAPAPKKEITLGMSRPRPLGLVYTFKARDGRRYDFVPALGLARIVALVQGKDRLRIQYDVSNPKRAHMESWLLMWIGPLLCFAFSGTVILIGLLSMVSPRMGFRVLDAVGTPFSFGRPLWRVLFESPRIGVRRAIDRYWADRAARAQRRLAQLEVAARIGTRRTIG